MVDVTQNNQKEAINWKNRGNSLAKQGDYEGALTCYNSGLVIDPNNTDLWHNKTLVLGKLGRIEESKQFQDKIKEIQYRTQTENNDKNYVNEQSANEATNPASHVNTLITPKKFCRSCGAQLESTDTTFCSSCGRNLKDSTKVSPIINEPVVQTVTPPIIPVAPQTTNSPKKYCPYCRSGLMFSEAEICPNCGMRLKDIPIQKQDVAHSPIKSGHEEEKSTFVAAICSFFIPGLGQTYNGELSKGIGFLIIILASIAILGVAIKSGWGFFLGFIVWIGNIYDAYSTAKKMNKGQKIFKSTKSSHMIIFIILFFILSGLFALFTAAILVSSIFGSSTSPTLGSGLGTTGLQSNNAPFLSNYDSPESVLQKSITAFNDGDDTAIYNMMSSKLQSQYDSTKVHNIVTALHSPLQQISYSNLKITDTTSSGDVVRMKVDVIIEAGGYQKLEHQAVELIKENGVWKLNSLFPVYNIKTKSIAVTAQKNGQDIVITFYGGSDAKDVASFIVSIDGGAPIVGSSLTKAVGSSQSFTGTSNSKNNVRVTAIFVDSSEQLVLDTSV